MASIYPDKLEAESLSKGCDLLERDVLEMSLGEAEKESFVFHLATA